MKKIEEYNLNYLCAKYQKDRHGCRMITNGYFAMMTDGVMRQDFMLDGNVYLHRHPFLVMITAGSVAFSVDMENFVGETGDIILLRGNTIHELQSASEDMDNITICLGDEVAVDEDIMLHATPEEWHEMNQLVQMLWTIAKRQPFRKDIVTKLLDVIVSNIQNIAREHELKQPSVELSKTERTFYRFRRLVNQYATTERNVSFYAEQLCLSPHQLSVIVRDVGGDSVTKWINRAVCLHAKALLKTTSLKGLEIAEQLHFPDYSSFSKFFKRETGFTPREFRA